MTIKRIPIENLTDANHGRVALEGNSWDRLPKSSVYVDPKTGKIIDGSKGATLGELRGDEVELPRTTWHQLSSCEYDRLRKETLEMMKIFGLQFNLLVDNTKPNWEAFFWKGHHPSGRHTITACYSKTHPYGPMRIFVAPNDLDTHHKFKDGSICYLKESEWNPNWTAATAIGTAIRYLTTYYQGALR